MNYDGIIIRPPSEAHSILLQVTTGCSHNQCTFCGAYKEKRFSIKPESTIDEDLVYAAHHFQETRQLFLCDGDALIIPQERLLNILHKIKQHLPWVRRVSTYANAKSISRKSDTELRDLRKAGVRLLHMGLESGHDETLDYMKKWGDSAFIVDQGKRVRAADIGLFVTVLLGLGGVKNSQQHALKTGKALTAMDPNYVGTLSLMLLENTPLYKKFLSGEFVLPDPIDLLKELRVMLANTNLTHGLFFSNHASNYLPIRARLPNHKQDVLRKIDAAINGDIPLRPEWTRGL